METSVSGPGTASFWWKVSSRTNVHPVQFLVDGVAMAQISGEVNWTRAVLQIQPGIHLLRWLFANTNVAGSGSNAAWVDQVVWTPTTSSGVPIAWYQGFGLSPSDGQPWDTLDSLPAASGDPNWFQYAAGLDPTDPNALFRILGIIQAAGEPTQIHWLGGTNGPDTPYLIQCATNLEEGIWNSTGSSPRVRGLNVWTNAPPADVKRYYRVLAPRIL